MNETLHLTPEELNEFDNLYYDDHDLTYTKLQNVIVLRSGICIKRGLIVKNSLHRYPHLYLKFIINAYGSWLKRGVISLDTNKSYIVIHNIWSGGYYHWITESLARLEPVMKFLSDSTILLPSNTKLDDVMVQSLECFGVENVEFFPPESNLFVKNLLLPQNPLRHREISRRSLEFVRSNILKKISSQEHSSEIPKKIFISRKISRGRKILNEGDVVDLLESRGYKTVFMENMSFFDQVKLMEGADIVVSQHGAGLTNIIFLPQGAKVLELFRKVDGKENRDRRVNPAKLIPTFPRLASRLGLNYFCLLCEAVSPQQSVSLGDIIVDITDLKEKLRIVEATK